MRKGLVVAVASAIRHFRKSTQMSQEDLADKAGLDRTYISGVERGVRNITLESMELIIHALGVDTKSFLYKVAEELNGSKDN